MSLMVMVTVILLALAVIGWWSSRGSGLYVHDSPDEEMTPEEAAEYLHQSFACGCVVNWAVSPPYMSSCSRTDCAVVRNIFPVPSYLAYARGVLSKEAIKERQRELLG